jgi:hypothetical protein
MEAPIADEAAVVLRKLRRDCLDGLMGVSLGNVGAEIGQGMNIAGPPAHFQFRQYF